MRQIDRLLQIRSFFRCRTLSMQGVLRSFNLVSSTNQIIVRLIRSNKARTFYLQDTTMSWGNGVYLLEAASISFRDGLLSIRGSRVCVNAAPLHRYFGGRGRGLDSISIAFRRLESVEWIPNAKNRDRRTIVVFEASLQAKTIRKTSPWGTTTNKLRVHQWSPQKHRYCRSTKMFKSALLSSSAGAASSGTTSSKHC